MIANSVPSIFYCQMTFPQAGCPPGLPGNFLTPPAPRGDVLKFQDRGCPKITVVSLWCRRCGGKRIRRKRGLLVAAKFDLAAFVPPKDNSFGIDDDKLAADEPRIPEFALRDLALALKRA